MRTIELTDGGHRVIVVAVDKGEEAVAVVNEVAKGAGVRGARVTAVGGFHRAEVGYFDRQARDYLRIPVPEQVEVLSLLGDIAEDQGEPALHVHAVLGRRDGTTVGGHLLRGEVWPTLEVIITEVGGNLTKRFDPETGLALLNGSGQG
ncbi:PPC domain-containing DNA-binding protein [Micromonospora sp. WMMD1082]|uniref:PPC domain-containing DNA-binding protein n=1 Tax=Micromonospora sp. WMMD1082 TaxID=3016104 RepID=UPI002416441A|nr:PPC domain-containing DNA-binding protein [Micromonospora sp. WMMD1082]MDG4797171.1 DNA-binding protein [Micromonospora sp. WMMD1082]